MILIIILLTVGFAAVTTTLFINGTTSVSTNMDDFQVYYSEARIGDGTNTPTKDNSVITDDTHIAFTTEIKHIGDKYVLEYDVTNGSKNYDANVVMQCTGGNDYLKVTNVFNDDDPLLATTTRTGTLTLEQIKSYAGDAKNEVTIECTIVANATERESQGTNTVPEKVENGPQWINKGKYSLLKAEGNTANDAEVGDEIAVGEEHFYVISNDGESLKSLAKYNLLVGNEYDPNSYAVTPLTNPTGIQSPLARGGVVDADKFIGTVAFSNNRGWPYANNDNINIKEYAGPVKTALYDETTGYESYIQQTAPNATRRLITKSELETLGCSSESGYCISSFEYTCDDWAVKNDYKGCSTHQEGETITVQTGATAPEWVYSTSFWSGSAYSDPVYSDVWIVDSENGGFYDVGFRSNSHFGVRSVIILES